LKVLSVNCTNLGYFLTAIKEPFSVDWTSTNLWQI
jgi:hypothetical protein